MNTNLDYRDRVCTRYSKRPIVITQRGKSAAVLQNASENEALLQKIELFVDVQTAENQIDERLGIDHEEAKRRLTAENQNRGINTGVRSL